MQATVTHIKPYQNEVGIMAWGQGQQGQSQVCQFVSQVVVILAGSLTRLILAHMSAACVLILVVYHVIKETVWLCLTMKTYFLGVQNYIEWILLTTATIFVVFVYINDCGCPSSWQWQIGIFAIFLGWLNMIFFASNIPWISIYVIMFREIFLTFFKLLLFALLLITAFSIVLFMMFYNPTPTAKVRDHNVMKYIKYFLLLDILIF